MTFKKYSQCLRNMYHRKQYVSTAKYDTYGMKYDSKMLETYARVIEELRAKMQKMQNAKAKMDAGN